MHPFLVCWGRCVLSFKKLLVSFWCLVPMCQVMQGRYMAPWSYTGDTKDASEAFSKLVSVLCLLQGTHPLCTTTQLRQHLNVATFIPLPPISAILRPFAQTSPSPLLATDVADLSEMPPIFCLLASSPLCLLCCRVLLAILCTQTRLTPHEQNMTYI